MKSKWLLNLLLAALAAALGALAYYAPRGGERGTFALSPLAARDVKLIRIERPAGASHVIERKAQAWYLSAPFAAPAEPDEVDRLLAILATRSPQRMAPTELARFGLESPSLKITFNRETFAFGLVNAVTREQYVLASGAVYLIEPRHSVNVPSDPMLLVRRRLLPDGAEAVRIELPAGTLARGPAGWSMAPARPGLAQEAIERLAGDWQRATAKRVARAGAEPALARVRIELESGAAITLDVVLLEPALVLRRPDFKLEYTLAAGSRRLLALPATAPRD